MLRRRKPQVPAITVGSLKQFKGIPKGLRQEWANTIGDQTWRLNHLYKIVVDDKGGEEEAKRQTLKLAWAQKDLYDNLWYRKHRA